MPVLMAGPVLGLRGGLWSRIRRAKPSVTCLSSARSNDKIVYLIRHGQTEMNCWLRDFRIRNGPNVEVTVDEDPLLYDTALTTDGIRGALRLQDWAARANPRPEVVLVSPLSRALHTADIAFAGQKDIPRHVEPLATEKVWHSSDVGSRKKDLEAKWGDIYDGSGLDDVWWYTGGTGDPRAIVDEPQEVFLTRMGRLIGALQEREESVMALVCHWGVINALTGCDFDNCEVRGFRLSDIAVRGLPEWALVSD